MIFVPPAGNKQNEATAAVHKYADYLSKNYQLHAAKHNTVKRNQIA
jgi:hypothetical protein